MQITRRTAIATGAAAITTAAITAPLALKAGATKAALGGEPLVAGDPAVVVSQQLRAAWRAWLAAMAAFDGIKDCGIPTCGKGGPDCALRQEQEQCEARFFELQTRLLNTPATTSSGVLGKLRGFYGDDEIAQIRAGEEPDDLPGDYVVSIFLDLERLSQGVPS